MTKRSNPPTSKETPVAKEVREYLADPDSDPLVFADGYEDAFLGTAFSPHGLNVAVYDADECIECLQRDGMTDEEAMEFFDRNTAQDNGPGERTPMYLSIWPSAGATLVKRVLEAAPLAALEAEIARRKKPKKKGR